MAANPSEIKIPGAIFVLFEMRLGASTCVTCEKKVRPGNMTCSEDCHEKFIYKLEQRFGVYKKITDVETGKSHKVPIRTIVEVGVKYPELKRFPLWEE